MLQSPSVPCFPALHAPNSLHLAALTGAGRCRSEVKGAIASISNLTRMPPPVFWTFIRLCTSCARRSQALTGRAHVTGRVNPGHAQTAAMMMSARDVQDATKTRLDLGCDLLNALPTAGTSERATTLHVLPGGGCLCARSISSQL